MLPYFSYVWRGKLTGTAKIKHSIKKKVQSADIIASMALMAQANTVLLNQHSSTDKLIKLY